MAVIKTGGSQLQWNDKDCSDSTHFRVICEFDGQGLTPTGKQNNFKLYKIQIYNFLDRFSVTTNSP